MRELRFYNPTRNNWSRAKDSKFGIVSNRGLDLELVLNLTTGEWGKRLGLLLLLSGATHMIPFDDPALFNATVERFLRTPFRKVEMLNDTVKSLEKMRTAQ